MSLKEEIVATLEGLPEYRLSEIYDLVKRIKDSEEQPGFLKKLQKIKISGLPSDFSRNIDLYMNGEKQIDENAD